MDCERVGNNHKTVSNVGFNKETIMNRLKNDYGPQLMKSIDVYLELYPVSRDEAEAKILDLSYKAHYIKHIITKFGNSDTTKLLVTIKSDCHKNKDRSPFYTEEDLISFLDEMAPLFMYRTLDGVFQNTWNEFRELIKEVATTLKEGHTVNETVLQKIFQKFYEKEYVFLLHHPALLSKINLIENLESLSFFTYNKRKKEVQLAANSKKYLALWLPILDPQLDVFKESYDERSLELSQNANIVAWKPKYKPDTFIGAFEEYQYNCRRKKDGFKNEQPNHSCRSGFAMFSSTIHCSPNERRVGVVRVNEVKTSEFKSLKCEETNPREDLDPGVKKLEKMYFEITKHLMKCDENNYAPVSPRMFFRWDDEMEKYRILKSAISVGGKTKIISYEEITAIYLKNEGSRKKKRAKLNRQNFDTYNNRPGNDASKHCLSPPEEISPFSTDNALEEIKEFISSIGLPFEVIHDLVSLSSRIVETTVDNIRGLLYQHPEGLEFHEMEKICREKFSSNKMLDAALNEDRLLTILQLMPVVDIYYAEDGSLMLNLKENFKYPTCFADSP